LLRAFGYSSDEQLADLVKAVDVDPDFSWLKATLAKDAAHDETEGLREVYRRVRPGDLATAENAKTLIRAMFTNFDRYDFGAVGRYKLNVRFGENVPLSR